MSDLHARFSILVAIIFVCFSAQIEAKVELTLFTPNTFPFSTKFNVFVLTHTVLQCTYEDEPPSSSPFYRANLTAYLFVAPHSNPDAVSDEIIDLDADPTTVSKGPSREIGRILLIASAFAIVGHDKFLSISDEAGRSVLFRQDEVRTGIGHEYANILNQLYASKCMFCNNMNILAVRSCIIRSQSLLFLSRLVSRNISKIALSIANT
jgi:hypothetical protein